MADYHYPDDGKIHLRYSELVRCTHGQIDRLINEKENGGRFESEHMQFGTDRHEMWAEQSRRYGLLPRCFREVAAAGDLTCPLDFIEQEFVTEIAAGVCIHSRPDAVSLAAETIFDYKTVVDGSRGFAANVAQYKQSKQGKFYAFQLALHGHRIGRVVYLCEVWNADRTKIVGYHTVEQKLNLLEVAAMRRWAIERAAIYKAASKMRKRP